MSKVNINKDEILEIKYIRDNSFFNGTRQDTFRSSIEQYDMYGEIHFTNGLKLSINNTNGFDRVIKIKDKKIYSGKKYRIKYIQTWSGKTKYTNGKILKLTDYDYIFPSEIIQKNFKKDMPENVKEFLDVICIDENRKYKEINSNDLSVYIRWYNNRLYYRKELKWICLNMFKNRINDIVFTAISLYEYLYNSDTGYIGMTLDDIIDISKKDIAQSIGEHLEFEKAWDLLKNNNLITSFNNDDKYSPDCYRD